MNTKVKLFLMNLNVKGNSLGMNKGEENIPLLKIQHQIPLMLRRIKMQVQKLEGIFMELIHGLKVNVKMKKHQIVLLELAKRM